MIELLLICFILVLTVVSIFLIENKVHFNSAYKIKRTISISLLTIFVCACVSFLTLQLYYKNQFNQNGQIFKNSTIAKLETFDVSTNKFRLFPNEPYDIKDENFYKRDGIQAILVEENFNWIIKFVDPFSKNKEDDVVGGAILTAFVEKKSKGKIFGTEFFVEVYMIYNDKTNDYDKLSANISKHKTKLLSCTLDKQTQNPAKIIAKGSCNLIK